MENFCIDDVAEEIELSLGLKIIREGRNVYADTFVGRVPIIAMKTLMSSYYRFINVYGLRMSSYGLKMKLEEESK